MMGKAKTQQRLIDKLADEFVKWMVKGEVCVGLFAVRDIKKGEEVTFDYNYVRVFGAAAKKCLTL